MSPDLIQFGFAAFVTLVVVVDPVGAVPLFAAILRDISLVERRSVITRAVSVAFAVTVFFLLAGSTILSYLGVSVHAFAISGGILLFATALPMLFGQRAGLQSPEHHEQATAGEDLAIFPLAIPLLSGPGTIATVLLLANQTGTDIQRLGTLVLVLTAVYLAAWLALQMGQRLLERIGKGKVHIVTRVLGIILAAIAVQYVLNGIAGYYHLLAS